MIQTIRHLAKCFGLLTLLLCLVASTPAVAQPLPLFASWANALPFLSTAIAALLLALSSRALVFLLAHPGPDGEIAEANPLRDALLGGGCAILIALALTVSVVTAGYLGMTAWAGVNNVWG